VRIPATLKPMSRWLAVLSHFIRALVRSQSGLAIENAALQKLLAVEITKRWTSTSCARHPRAHSTHGARERLGRTADPLRASETRLGRERAHSLALPAEETGESGCHRTLEALLRNHRDAIGGMDFLTVPTVTFGVLYVFFIIDHARRRIRHVNVTAVLATSLVRLRITQVFGIHNLES
jgi:hypothetical protein